METGYTVGQAFQAGVSKDLGEVPLSPLPGIPGAKVLVTGCALC